MEDVVEQDEGDENKLLGDSFDYEGYSCAVTIFVDNTSSLEAVRTYWVSFCSLSTIFLALQLKLSLDKLGFEI